MAFLAKLVDLAQYFKISNVLDPLIALLPLILALVAFLVLFFKMESVWINQVIAKQLVAMEYAQYAEQVLILLVTAVSLMLSVFMPVTSMEPMEYVNSAKQDIIYIKAIAFFLHRFNKFNKESPLFRTY
jgi:hypothetical protein